MHDFGSLYSCKGCSPCPCNGAIVLCVVCWKYSKKCCRVLPELCSVGVGTFVSSPWQGDTIWAGITLLLIGRQAPRGAGETYAGARSAGARRAGEGEQGQGGQDKGSRGKEGRRRGDGARRAGEGEQGQGGQEKGSRDK